MEVIFDIAPNPVYTMITALVLVAVVVWFRGIKPPEK